MEFVIRIYGAPYGFELYEGSEQELNYFQVFDNGSLEPVKMTVHRLNNNQISYNYLRYGYVTSGGRTGSFFGMSVVFNKSYCSEFTRMYQLFEAVYGTIVNNAILFEELTTGQWQARYKIGKFSEAEDEVRRIKGVLAQNIQGTLASSIRSIDFSSSVSRDKELRLSANVGNELVSNAIKKYSIVTISPAYGSNGGDEVERIPVEELVKFPIEKNAILIKATEWSNKVSAFLINLRAHQDNKRDVSPLFPQYKSMMSELDGFAVKMETFLSKIQRCHNIEPSHSYFREEVQKEVATAKDNVNTLLGSLRLYKDSFEKGDGPKGGDGGTDKSDGPSAFEKFIHKNQKLLIMVGVVLCLIVGGVTIYNISRNDNPTDPTDPIDTTGVAQEPEQPDTLDTDSLTQKGLDNFNAGKYGEAYKDYLAAGKTDAASECKDQCMKEAKNKQSKDAGIKYFKDEMAKGDYTMVDQDRAEIEKAYSLKASGEATSAKKPATQKVNITVKQQGRGDITKSSEVFLGMRGTNLVTIEYSPTDANVTCKVNGDSKQKDSGMARFSFKVGEANTSYEIECFVDGSSVFKKTYKRKDAI